MSCEEGRPSLISQKGGTDLQYQFGSNFDPDRTPEEIARYLELAIKALGEIIIIDEVGRIVYMSDEYGRNMERSIPDSLGRPIREVVENSELPNVLESGRATNAVTFQYGGKSFWISRYPLMDGREVTGAVARCVLGSYSDPASIAKKFQDVVKELNYYKGKYYQDAAPRSGIDCIVTRNPKMVALKKALSKVAMTRSSVLLTGESGTGKEVFASTIHALSPRKNHPFIRLNCAAIPDNLIESELFGYEEGAFTGAVRGGKIGDFEAANGGSILLDEVDSLSPNMQAKLLRVIQEREIKKVGSTKTTPVDLRFLFATNKDLLELVREGSFREDFYYRINVIHLKIPPLRERMEDIPLLVQYFIEKLNKELEMNISGISKEALAYLEGYSWPGNIRELENCIERAFNYTRGTGMLQVEHIQLYPRGDDSVEPISLRDARVFAERRAIRRALDATGGNRQEAAKLLGINRSVLYDKLSQYHMTDEAGEGG